MQNEVLMRKIESLKDDMVDLQKHLTAIPALAPENGGDGEQEKALFLLNYLKFNGFKNVKVFNAPDINTAYGMRPNIIATIPGKNKDRTVWVITHTDVVPPGEFGHWHNDPYEACVSDGKIYGRGTEDNQQDLVASIFAARALIDEDITPENTVRLAFVADEETGSQKGLAYLLEEAGELFSKEDIIIVPDFGDETGSLIEIAEKSILWLKFTTRGRQGHASVPELGNNAFIAASGLVLKLAELPATFDSMNPLFKPPLSTFQPTKKENNVPNINTIPGEDIFYLDSRILPEYDLDEIVSEIRSICHGIEETYGVKVDIEIIQKVQAPPPTSKSAPVVRLLQDAVKKIYGIDSRPVGIGGGTVAAHLREKGYPAAAWSRLEKTAHQPNEYSVIENMVKNAKVYSYIFMKSFNSY